jgi:hypothetical protein
MEGDDVGARPAIKPFYRPREVTGVSLNNLIEVAVAPWGGSPFESLVLDKTLGLAFMSPLSANQVVAPKHQIKRERELRRLRSRVDKAKRAGDQRALERAKARLHQALALIVDNHSEIQGMAAFAISGECTLAENAERAQACGAKALIIANNNSDQPDDYGIIGEAPANIDISIPVVMISLNSAARLCKQQMDGVGEIMSYQQDGLKGVARDKHSKGVALTFLSHKGMEAIQGLGMLARTRTKYKRDHSSKFVPHLFNVHKPGENEDDRVDVESELRSALGKYELLPGVMHDEHHVYKHENGKCHLFYQSYWQQWRVATDVKNEVCLLRVKSKATKPDQIEEMVEWAVQGEHWMIWHRTLGEWDDASDVRVRNVPQEEPSSAQEPSARTEVVLELAKTGQGEEEAQVKLAMVGEDEVDDDDAAAGTAEGDAAGTAEGDDAAGTAEGDEDEDGEGVGYDEMEERRRERVKMLHSALDEDADGMDKTFLAIYTNEHDAASAFREVVLVPAAMVASRKAAAAAATAAAVANEVGRCIGSLIAPVHGLQSARSLRRIESVRLQQQQFHEHHRQYLHKRAHRHRTADTTSKIDRQYEHHQHCIGLTTHGPIEALGLLHDSTRPHPPSKPPPTNKLRAHHRVNRSVEAESVEAKSVEAESETDRGTGRPADNTTDEAGAFGSADGVGDEASDHPATTVDEAGARAVALVMARAAATFAVATAIKAAIGAAEATASVPSEIAKDRPKLRKGVHYCGHNTQWGGTRRSKQHKKSAACLFPVEQPVQVFQAVGTEAFGFSRVRSCGVWGYWCDGTVMARNGNEVDISCECEARFEYDCVYGNGTYEVNVGAARIRRAGGTAGRRTFFERLQARRSQRENCAVTASLEKAVERQDAWQEPEDSSKEWDLVLDKEVLENDPAMRAQVHSSKIQMALREIRTASAVVSASSAGLLNSNKPGEHRGEDDIEEELSQLHHSSTDQLVIDGRGYEKFEEGDTVEVSYQSKGCYHSATITGCRLKGARCRFDDGMTHEHQRASLGCGTVRLPRKTNQTALAIDTAVLFFRPAPAPSQRHGLFRTKYRGVWGYWIEGRIIAKRDDIPHIPSNSAYSSAYDVECECDAGADCSGPMGCEEGIVVYRHVVADMLKVKVGKQFSTTANKCCIKPFALGSGSFLATMARASTETPSEQRSTTEDNKLLKTTLDEVLVKMVALRGGGIDAHARFRQAKDLLQPHKHLIGCAKLVRRWYEHGCPTAEVYLW